MEKVYLNPQWKKSLEELKLNDFDTFWELDKTNWFEPPNIRRGGWSGVSKITYDESKPALFVKRQENHGYRSITKFFRLLPTFHREYENILLFESANIPTLELIYYGLNNNNTLKAVLVTNELKNFIDISHPTLKLKLSLEKEFKSHFFKSLADIIRRMHQQHIQHGCLYPKHIFLKHIDSHSIDIRLIDLEKARLRVFKKNAVIRDLATFNRHTQDWSRSDKLRFFLAYLEIKRLSLASKKMLKSILRPKHGF